MKIFVTKEPQQVYPGSHPAISLKLDPWNDYGFQTTYFATLWDEERNAHDLGQVKIIQSGLTPGQQDLGVVHEDGLPREFASLGASFDYYEQLASHPRLGCEVLKSLRDLAVDQVRYERFRNQHAYSASLVRLAPAKDALRRVQSLVRGLEDSRDKPESQLSSLEAAWAMRNSTDRVLRIADGVLAAIRVAASQALAAEFSGPLKVQFSPLQTPKKVLAPSTIEFDFSGPTELSNNLIAIVGPNGTGKTTLLAELALAIFFGKNAQAVVGTENWGEVQFSSGSVSDVVFISYSAYDSFEIPQRQELATDAKAELEQQGYVYVGLRQLNGENRDPSSKDRRHTLKSIRDIEDEFSDTLERLNRRGGDAIGGPRLADRRAIFASAAKQLLEDPSLSQRNPPAGAALLLRGSQVRDRPYGCAYRQSGNLPA